MFMLICIHRLVFSCILWFVISVGEDGLMDADNLATCLSMPGGNVSALNALPKLFRW